MRIAIIRSLLVSATAFLTDVVIVVSGNGTNRSDEQAKNDHDPLLYNFYSHIAWYQSQGGKIDKRVTIGYDPNILISHSNENAKVRGMIAKDLIPADTVLVHCPSSLILKPEEREKGKDACSLVESILRELKLREKSKWYPMFEYDDISGSRIPCQWERNGRAVSSLQGLLPAWGPHRHLDWYTGTCLKWERDETSIDELEMKALLTFLTRSTEPGLVPVYLLFNHNNALINTRLEYTEEDGMKIIANQDIQPNEAIYITYNRAGISAASDVFNIFGFIEDYPQIWRWPSKDGESIHKHGLYGVLTIGVSDLEHEPNNVSNEYEVLVISPTLAALSPTKKMVSDIGEKRITKEEWADRTHAHHANLRVSHVRKLQDSASSLLNSLPTNIEGDTARLNFERARMQHLKNEGKYILEDTLDMIKAIEYRLAYKKALILATEVSDNGFANGEFWDDAGEL